ncbi:5-methylcytosine restriction system specificity protein McrC [Gordonia sp. (in: high G+C Gram-positive bacteria)]|jgi:5-methylcytosine-specific restriction enzyme subunit McrC|uniref:McrC family protein n=1 Tax=Gordonia sp. (in: high G+C Gram-positive bacteria) TaxID=84139 RepID=UPI001D2CC1B4|nr:restriction endonuclease [Gordonia sp. (in: high G+C Gram-positive bacteria)]MCB1294385.1 restriction endonuclease [Gordonia sp. (in: high G+C Gram-positive bacteria)]HMS73999.1 restriction endonuclease [Gordonia sp. (in: high G+C Gram-positive bacteria)]
MPRSPLTLTEGGYAERQLTPDEYVALLGSPLVDVTPTLIEGVFTVRAAANKVGALAVGDLQIVVRPKITDLNRLIFLLGYAQKPGIWRDDPVHLTTEDDLFPALAEAFSRLATHATAQGLLQGYRTVTDSLPVLRGRVLAGEQTTRHYGFAVPLAVEYDEFTTDIAENQLLLAATLRMLRVAGITTTARRRLQRLHLAFAEVTPPSRGVPTPAWRPTRLNARYVNALRLAEVILAAQSFEHHAGDLAVSGYVFDMWRIFEDFVCTALGEAMANRGQRTATQHRIYLDIDDRVAMRPDLLCFDSTHNAIAAIDAKYKAEKPEGFPDADLYQMLAYCTALGLSRGHLIYAKGNEQPTVHTVRRAGVTIHCHALDLSLTPPELLGRINGLAASILITPADN